MQTHAGARLRDEFWDTINRGIVIDPTVFNAAERLRLIPEVLAREYRVGISSDIYFMVEGEEWEDLSEVLRNWEWNRRRQELAEWHHSRKFKAMCGEVLSRVVPCSSLLQDLNEEEKKRKQKFESTVWGSPRIVEIAKELVKISTVKSSPVLSFTRHAKRWFKTCRNVLILDIADAWNSTSEAKKRLKKRVTEAGWEGYLVVFFFGLTTDKILESLLPPPVGSIIGFTSGGSFVVGVLADGEKMVD
jgi:hypothetical protein